MNTPFISIVLPTYNGSRYIGQSIESCLAQSFHNFELIIVNDCSTDNTLEIINEFAKADARVVVINNTFNKKLPLSLNTGFEVARGDYYTWTSDDNFYSKDALATMINVCEHDNTIDLVYADYTLIDENGKITGSRTFGDINKSFSKWLGCGACFLYKKSVHQQNNGYRPEAFLIEDYDFFVRAFAQNKFYYLPNTDLYFYREHSASLTSTQNTFINDVSKMFLEKNLMALERKLPKYEAGLLYRKFAVYYAVQKNNIEKYKTYLAKLNGVSKTEMYKTVFYVLLQKTKDAFVVSISGILKAIELLFKK
ncbi:MAG: glycosyltransferase [Flavobacterium sp.]|nr:MAG: glycosyltransferase [Flavobacterium sp.]